MPDKTRLCGQYITGGKSSCDRTAFSHGWTECATRFFPHSLQTLAEDFAGGEVTGVQFYVNQELQTLWLGIFEFLELDAPQYDDLALVLDDGSDRDEVTFVFDTDRVLSNGGGEADQPIGRSSNMSPMD